MCYNDTAVSFRCIKKTNARVFAHQIATPEDQMS